ncbi:hypothetical protein GTW56_30500 [Bacillus sp. EB93]|nr:hypothetical protein [Peribacillus frigoritolerans]
MDNNTKKKIESEVKKSVDIEIAQELSDFRNQLNSLQSSLSNLQQRQQQSGQQMEINKGNNSLANKWGINKGSNNLANGTAKPTTMIAL